MRPVGCERSWPAVPGRGRGPPDVVAGRASVVLLLVGQNGQSSGVAFTTPSQGSSSVGEYGWGGVVPRQRCR